VHFSKAYLGTVWIPEPMVTDFKLWRISPQGNALPAP
jgi:hypothetical protein